MRIAKHAFTISLLLAGVVAAAQVSLHNNNGTLKQDQQRYQNGSISRVQLQSSQTAVLKSSYGVNQADNNYTKALNARSSSAGLEITGMIAGIAGVS